MDPVIEKYMRVAIAEAFIARAAGENPFGAVLLEPEGNFCHKAHSRSIELNDPTAHAEILAIREYCAEKKMVCLRDYILICSGEPCVMCSGAIKWAKIGKIYYSVPQPVINRISGGKPKPSCESIINSGEAQKLIIGNVLQEEGMRVFEDYRFIPQDGRR
ncbi:MAG: tRNA-specific adenosine deaminase [Clostridiales bacterium]|nr:tRNA-specific adenosine deaminase [Clostridiales bacterium]